MRRPTTTWAFASTRSVRSPPLTLDDLPGAIESWTHALRLAPATPFVFVSGVIGEDNAVELLKQGATDYVSKGRMARLPLVFDRPERVGVVGLGTGTLACYALPTQYWTFFEIDPVVADLARTLRVEHGWRDVAAVAVKAGVVVPVDPLEGRDLDVVEAAPRASSPDEFLLV